MSALVLVVEDNPANMKLAVMLLQRSGYATLCAENAANGIALARRYLPDLIIMDIQLPGMDGLEAVRRIRADAALRYVKVLALTALAMRGDEESALAAGCDGYMAKPIQYQEFLAKVASMLKENGG